MLSVSKIISDLISYKGIYDCPVKNYVDSLTDNDLSYLTKYKRLAKLFKLDLSNIFDRINDQLIDEFKISNTRELWFYKMKSMLIMACDYHIYGKKSLQTKIQILQKQIEKLEQDQNKDIDIRKLYSTNFRIIQKWSGRDPKKLTIFEYFNDLNDYNKEIADANKNNIRSVSR